MAYTTGGSYQIDARELADLAAKYKDMGPKFTRALNATINWVGARANTEVRRNLSTQMGAPQKEIGPMLNVYPSTFGRLEYTIRGTGRPLSLRAFGAQQRAKGVSARPWGTRRVFPGTFIIKSLGGSVYKRTGEMVTATKGKNKGRKVAQIEKLWGPGVPRELVRGFTVYAFDKTVKERFPERLEHEVARVLARMKR
jgi:hypothetical protein